MKIIFIVITLILGFLSPYTALAQGSDDTFPYQFTSEVEIPHTAVKSQDSTGSCWCFSAISFLESELIRMNRGEYDLSEMFIVRHVYPLKARNYIRLHGYTRFDQGSLSHDVINAVRDYGLVPESVYSGLLAAQTRHDHREMIKAMRGMLDGVLDEPDDKISTVWPAALEGILDAYLGEPSRQFSYNGKTYTPKDYAASLNLNLDKYIELTSFTHHPFYQQMRLEVPDNWCANDQYFNLPIDELERVVDHSLKSGYSVIWGGDVSEDTYASNQVGFAIIPEEEENFPPEKPVKEKQIDQDMRQVTFDNHTTTDDHAVHIIGLVRDQRGELFYKIKDSWFSRGVTQGYLYYSKPYFRLKTTAIMINRDTLPDDIAKKLRLK
ncbi:MAG: aminopeptidase [bacterium]|nr:MAG: aminopeptidase [bacterium]